MTSLSRNLHVTHALPLGRARMRYVRLKAPMIAMNAADEDDAADVQCFACAATIIGAVRSAAVAGLAVQCPQCGTISEI